ncbi:hypothetical protein FACS189487_01200 [Campylobacterota bacterium]|nr:hypothetical protein FACS189487_01200 [Campylobacterota bacterium]
MDKYDIRDELLVEVGARPVLRMRHLVYVLFAAGFALYIYNLFYGSSSILMMMSLKDERAALELRIDSLKSENAQLRRDLYELKLIYGETIAGEDEQAAKAAGR